MQTDAAHRRARTWGPFTGRQLTVIAITLIIVIGLPVGASAVTGSNVFIADPATGKHASVDTAGNLHTAGTATRANPKSSYQKSTFLSASYQPIAQPPAGKALVITSVAINVNSLANPGLTVAVIFDGTTKNADCGSTLGAGFETVFNPATLGTTVLPFDPGVVIKSGRATCAVDLSTVSANVLVTGYLIPAADA